MKTHCWQSKTMLFCILKSKWKLMLRFSGLLTELIKVSDSDWLITDKHHQFPVFICVNVFVSLSVRHASKMKRHHFDYRRHCVWFKILCLGMFSVWQSVWVQTQFNADICFKMQISAFYNNIDVQNLSTSSWVANNNNNNNILYFDSVTYLVIKLIFRDAL